MRNYKNILFIILIFCFAGHLNAEGDKGKKQNNLYKTNGEPEYTKFNINNISTFVRNNGEADLKPNGYNAGFEFPKGSSKYAVYASGLLWGAKINNEIRVGGSTYSSGLLPGKIYEDGSREDENSEKARVYCVRRDYKTGHLTDDASDRGITIAEAYNQYEKDWNEWRVSDGAPFEDINNNGIYEPGIDIPGVPGADQTLWFVVNDFDETTAKNLFGSSPLGIEVQVTVWGYNSNSFLKNVIFKKYKIINKSDYEFKEMYLSIWSDIDIGDAADDLAGCDTLLNLGFVYNANNYDGTYGLTPAATGFQILKAPEQVESQLNKKMTSFYIKYPGSYDYGIVYYYESAFLYYNMFQGKIGYSGQHYQIPDEYGGGESKYAFFGDPLKENQWVDGISIPKGDRRMGVNTGPFNLSTGDTTEIIFTEFAAVGKDRLNAVRILKYYAALLQENYPGYSNFTHKITQPEISIKENGFSSYQNITLEWGGGAELFQENDYRFQGYNIYQFYSDLVLEENGIKIATFDVKDGIKNILGIVMDSQTGEPINGNIQNGSDSGIKYEIDIDKDYTTGGKFLKGKEYHFGVSSYYYNEITNESLESDLRNIKIKFQDILAGPAYSDKIETQKISGTGTLDISLIVNDPEQLTGHNYKISFEENNEALTWNLFDETLNKKILSRQELSDPYVDPFNNISQIADGIEFRVYDYKPAIAGRGNGVVEVKYAGVDIPESEWDAAGRPYKGNTVWNEENRESLGPRDRYYISASRRNIHRLEENIKYAAPYDYELRFSNKENNFAVWRDDYTTIVSVPFELWNIGVNTPDDVSDDYRLIPFIKSQNNETASQWGWATGIEYLTLKPISDYIFWYDVKDTSPGEKGYNYFANTCVKSGGAGAAYDFKYDIEPEKYDYNKVNKDGIYGYLFGYMTICDYDEDGQMPPSGTVIRINTTKKITPEDAVVFTAPSFNLRNVIEDFYLYQNYPNPFNPTTKIRFSLPEEGVVKLDVYNILGQKVLTLVNQHMNAGIYEKEFQANNLSSGVYIYRLQVNNKFIETKKMVLLK